MTPPTFSLIYSTARQHLIPQTIRTWIKSADARWDVQFVICTDGGSWRGVWDGSLDKLCVELKIRKEQFIISAVKNPPFNCTRAWELAAKLSTGKILVCVADDLEPQAQWDFELLETLKHEKMDESDEFVLFVNDGSEKGALTHPIMSRTRYEKVGCFFYPHFQSMYSDNEVWRKASRDEVLVDARHVLIKHIHPDFGLRPKDAVDAVQSSGWRLDESRRLFDWLEKNDWPNPSGLVPQKHSDYVAYMQVIRDDFFLPEICERLIDEGVGGFFFHVPSHTWSGKSCLENNLAATGLFLASKCPHVKFQTVNSEPQRGESRIQCETRIRNQALKDMRSIGWHFPLIVDSDELWVKGTLAKVHALAKEGVQVIRVKMTSVAGQPPNSYPIDGKDHATVYIGPDTEFAYCRNPVAPMHSIDEVGIYHFSAVRRTKELLFEKMMGSGHFDEADYDFPKWLLETLPRIKPGEKRVHMSTTIDAWPEVREWERRDLEVLPEAIKTFLQL